MGYVAIGCCDSTIDEVLRSTKLLGNEELFLLSKRIVKCKRWRWEAGMLLRSETHPELTIRLSKSPDWDAHVFCGGYPDMSDEETVCAIVNRIRVLTNNDSWFPSPLYPLDEDRCVWLVEPPSKNTQTLYSSCQDVLVVVYSKL